MTAKIHTDVLRVWHLGVICRLHRPRTDKPTSAYADRQFADGTLNRRTYSANAVDRMLNSGLLIVHPHDPRRLTINPEVTEEQWDGVHVLYALRKVEPTSEEALNDTLRAFVHATTSPTET